MKFKQIEWKESIGKIVKKVFNNPFDSYEVCIFFEDNTLLYYDLTHEHWEEPMINYKNLNLNSLEKHVESVNWNGEVQYSTIFNFLVECGIVSVEDSIIIKKVEKLRELKKECELSEFRRTKKKYNL